MQPRILYFSILSFLLLALSCREGSDIECYHGTPSAILSSKNPSVLKHEFILDSTTMEAGLGISSVERAYISDTIGYKIPMTLEIQQQGCDDIFQLYNFIYKVDFGDGNVSKVDYSWWLERAATEFFKLSKLQPSLSMYNQWGQVILEAKDKNLLRLGEQLEVEESTYIKVNRIVSDQGAIITVEISQIDEE